MQFCVSVFITCNNNLYTHNSLFTLHCSTPTMPTTTVAFFDRFASNHVALSTLTNTEALRAYLTSDRVSIDWDGFARLHALGFDAVKLFVSVLVLQVQAAREAGHPSGAAREAAEAKSDV